MSRVRRCVRSAVAPSLSLGGAALAVALVLTSCGGGSGGGEVAAPRAVTSGEAAGLPDGDDVAIDRVVDGDTIVVDGGERVRLIGIDTHETKDPREPVACFGEEASQRTGTLLPAGTRVRLVYDVERTDRYERTLAYVYRVRDGMFVNAALVRDGYAFAYTYPPNVAHADELVALQREAREAGRGLWAECPAEGGEGSGGATGCGAAGGGGSGSNGVPTSGRGTASTGGECEPAYPDVCIPPAPPDLDCGDISDRYFTVLPPDPHRFDSDGNGVGCESR